MNWLKENWFKGGILAAVLIAGVSMSYYLFSLSPRAPKVSIVEETLKCNELYQLKKERYWGEKIGQDRVIYSRDLKTCLAANLHNDFDTGDFHAMVIDMENDKTLLSYLYFPAGARAFEVKDEGLIYCEEYSTSLNYTENGKEFADEGCERSDLMNKASEKIKSFGFEMRVF